MLLGKYFKVRKYFASIRRTALTFDALLQITLKLSYFSFVLAERINVNMSIWRYNQPLLTQW